MMVETRQGTDFQALVGLMLGGLLLSGSVMAQGGFYKWIDEQGQVHYTQSPPPDPQRYQAEEINLNIPRPTTMAPTVKEGKSYCGSQPLPEATTSPVATIFIMRKSIERWEKSLEELQKKNDEESRQGGQELRCAIAYAGQKLNALSEVEQGLNDNYERVKGELEDVEQNLAQCDSPERDEELSSAECKQQYQVRVSQLKKMLRVLEQPKKILEQGE